MDQREDIYSMLGLMLNNGKMLGESLQYLQSIQGKDLGVKAARVMLQTVSNQVEDGVEFGRAMAEWVSPEEAALLDVGERSGALDAACGEAIANVRLKKQLVNDTLQGAMKPAFLGAGVLGLLWMIATMLGPMFESMLQGKDAEGAIGFLIVLSQIFQAVGLYVGIAIAAFVCWTIHMLPRLTGRWRLRFERIPRWTGYGIIWQVYRDVQGALWLKNLVTLGRAGLNHEEALAVLNQSATPYLKERNAAVSRGLTAGLGLGGSLADSGLSFPSERAIRLLQKIDEMTGADKSLEDFSSRWVDRIVRELQKSMNVLVAIAMLGAAVMVVTVIAAMAEIQDTVEEQTDQI
ncbi:type II secretion system F family protein [Xanthomonas arboricola]|uniref:type II secretion system F family protein n=1 Tax=Xanthomonas arboricola TaxID=56448 RepID=UPI0015E275F5|nr:type II secretion system F family protein [Xanthomonas arboricola]